MSFDLINQERNDRNKSSYVWCEKYDKDDIRVKLEIGSSLVPYPISARKIKTYI